MHARVVTVRVARGKMDEVVRLTRETILPAAQQQPGFKAGYVLVDEPALKVVGITFWETEDDLLASRSAYLEANLAKAISLFDEPSVIGHYEVRVASPL